MIKNNREIKEKSQHFNIAYELGARLSDTEAIYKGLKFFADGRILRTDTDFYRPIGDEYEKIFKEKGFEIGLKVYLCDKYLNKLRVIEDSIRDEISGDNNHKKLKWLKTSRETLINKYNEVNR